MATDRCGFGTTVHLLDVESGEVVDSLTAPTAVNGAFWGGPDGRRLGRIQPQLRLRISFFLLGI